MKEIRTDILQKFVQVDFNYLYQASTEIIHALRFSKRAESIYILTPEYIGYIFSNPTLCRKLIRQLREKEIHEIIQIIIPSESEFIISYARLINKHRDYHYFSGKAGTDLNVLKWEFIFSILYKAPLSVFSRKQFVISIIGNLANHYNLTTMEVITFLLSDKLSYENYAFIHILPILKELQKQLPVTLSNINLKDHSEDEIHQIIYRLIPEEYSFIILYAGLLEKISARIKTERKSGTDFNIHKWEFIISSLIVKKNATFQRKYFIISILRKLAAHYNLSIIEVLGYVGNEFSGYNHPMLFMEMKEIISGFSKQIIRTQSGMSKLNKEQLTKWIIYIYGNKTAIISETDKFAEEWLMHILQNHNDLFRDLWKSGKLNSTYLFKLINSGFRLQILWVKYMGDYRLLEIWKIWQKKYNYFSKQNSGLYFFGDLAGYFNLWIIQLSSRRYISWSEKEIHTFLSERVANFLPSGIKILFPEINNPEEETTHQLWNSVFHEKQPETLEINNAGILLPGIFFKQLFHRLNFLEYNVFKNDESKIRAIFVLQYLLYGEERSYPETELYINKLIVGWKNKRPLPMEFTLSSQEKKITDSLFDGIRSSWTKLKNTGNEAIRKSFLQRKGILRYKPAEIFREITIEEKTYDVLLDSIPWNYYIQKFNWSNITFKLNWRNRL